MTTPHPFRIDIWHNILWSRYKAGVFSALYKQNDPEEFAIRLFQMAETSGQRMGLSAVDLSCHDYPYTLLFNGAIDRVGFGSLFRALLLHAWTTDAELSLLTGYERPQVWAQFLVLKLRRKKAVFFCDSTVFDQPPSLLKSVIKKILFKSADGFFGYGARARDYVLGYGVRPEQWHRRCQAAALPDGYEAGAALQERLRLAAKADAPRFVYIGRLSLEKNLERLLRAFAGIRRQTPKAELILIGDGPQKGELVALARSLDLNPDALFIGSKSGAALFEEYSKATCFVLPSLSEPWGLVVNEALSYGCPVVVSARCGCVPELVIEGVTGFVHDPFDVDDLANKMLAAVERFGDVEKTARDCLKLMEAYTPDRAASQMLAGIRAILRNEDEDHAGKQ